MILARVLGNQERRDDADDRPGCNEDETAWFRHGFRSEAVAYQIAHRGGRDCETACPPDTGKRYA